MVPASTSSWPGAGPPEGALTIAGKAAAEAVGRPAVLLGTMASGSIFWVCLLGIARRWEILLLPLLRGQATLLHELAGAGLLIFALASASSALGALSLSWSRLDRACIPQVLGALLTAAATAVLACAAVLLCQLTALTAALTYGFFDRQLQAAALLAFVAIPCSLLLTFVLAGSHLALARIRSAAPAPSPLAGPLMLAAAVADLLADPLRSLRLLGMLALVTAPGLALAGLAFSAALASPSLAASLLLVVPAALGSGGAAATLARGLQRGFG